VQILSIAFIEESVFQQWTADRPQYFGVMTDGS
jgi:hypothetical protein